MNFLQTVLAFILSLGPLIILHELGHYGVARLFGVKVARFSIGMGRVVWSRKVGPDQTEWAVSALPIGGYVKWFDSREYEGQAFSEADLARQFTRQGPLKRIAIAAAGPATNFLVAILLFTCLFMHGIEEPATRVRAMPEQTAAYQAGLRGGDLVTAVNGNPVSGWTDLHWELVQAVVDHQDARLEVTRAEGGSVHLTLPAAQLAGLNIETDVLGTLGFGVALPPAGLVDVMADGQGAAAGLKAGDIVTAIDGKPIANGMGLIDAVRAAPGLTLQFDITRAGTPLRLEVTPDADPVSKKGRIKVRPNMAVELVTVGSNPASAFVKASRKTWENATFIVKMVGKMVTGEVSIKNVTGPITIADYAGQSARLGIISYLTFIALISISLGVMNLLPIPALDGGQMLYYSVEVLAGRPLPARVDDIVQRAGLGLLVMLMALAVFNDVARLL
jgi:regulator of sigma E protease